MENINNIINAFKELNEDEQITCMSKLDLILQDNINKKVDEYCEKFIHLIDSGKKKYITDKLTILNIKTQPKFHYKNEDKTFEVIDIRYVTYENKKLPLFSIKHSNDYFNYSNYSFIYAIKNFETNFLDKLYNIVKKQIDDDNL